MMLRAAVHRDKINKTNENKEDAMAFKIESSLLDACVSGDIDTGRYLWI